MIYVDSLMDLSTVKLCILIQSYFSPLQGNQGRRFKTDWINWSARLGHGRSKAGLLRNSAEMMLQNLKHPSPPLASGPIQGAHRQQDKTWARQKVFLQYMWQLHWITLLFKPTYFRKPPDSLINFILHCWFALYIRRGWMMYSDSENPLDFYY